MEIKEIIEKIDWQVSYNQNHSGVNPECELVKNTLDAAKALELWCSNIIKMPTNKVIVENAILNIESICGVGEDLLRGMNYKTGLREMSKVTAKVILSYSKELIIKCEGKVTLASLDKYIGRWLYFEGYEDGSLIIRVSEFIQSKNQKSTLERGLYRISN